MSWVNAVQIVKGAISSRPAANAVPPNKYGWFATDTHVLSISDGTAWTDIGPGGGTASVTFGTPAVALGTAAAFGSIAEAIRRDSTIVAFDATVPVTQAFGDSAATGSAAVAARRDHKHAMPATPVTSINKTGSTALTGAVTLTAGTGATLTQSGQDISIAATASGTGYIGYILVRDERTAGTHGGGFTSGSYQTRVLQTEVTDTNNDCSLASNQLTLTAGTYEAWISCTFYRCGLNKSRLRNVTDSTTVLVGHNAYGVNAADDASGISLIVGRFTIAASKALEVQHQCQTTKATDGYGTACNMTEPEVYTIVELKRVS